MPEHVLVAGTRPVRTPRAGRALVAAGLAVEVAVGGVVLAPSFWPHGGAPLSPAAAARTTAVATGPGAPTRVVIPAIGVDAVVDPLGLRPDGHVEVPATFDRVGWYAGSAAPGAPGATVLLGHIDSTTGPAVFYRLGRLRPGDEIVVDRADVAITRFVVDRVAQFPTRRFPTADVYGPTPAPALRLITCAGPFHGRYRDNLVVFAHLAS